MAKNTVYLDVIIDDKGTMKRIAVDADKLSKQLGHTATNAATADRNLKGAAKASSNATKNFSKMAQGISGGIVPAYATLAAQLFALTAAFQALKTIADVRVQLQGQEGMTMATGTAYEYLTKQIQRATESQLRYNEAAQAASIGIAAGLDQSQIKRIATLSNAISKSLGRDITDTFNRLVRGITKAEPELLDELGIVLRLADASREYARQLGTTANQLTLWERTQGVFNFTVEQGERKFKALMEAFAPAPNAFNQLAVAFDNFYRTVANSDIVKIFGEGFARLITENVPAAITALGLLVGMVVKQLLPSFSELEKNSEASLKNLNLALNRSTEAFKKNAKALDFYKTEFAGAQTVIKEIQKDIKGAPSGTFSKNIEKTLSSFSTMTSEQRSRAIRELGRIEQQAAKIGDAAFTAAKGRFKGFTASMAADARVALTLMGNAQSTWVTQTVTGFKIVEAAAATTYNRMKIMWLGAVAAAQRFGTALLTWGVRILNIAGGLGVLILVGTTLYEAWKWMFDTEEETVFSKLEKERQEFNKNVEEYISGLQKIEKGRKLLAGATPDEIFAFYGRTAGSVDLVVHNKQLMAITEQWSKMIDAKNRYTQMDELISSTNRPLERLQKFYRDLKAEKNRTREQYVSDARLVEETIVAAVRSLPVDGATLVDLDNLTKAKRSSLEWLRLASSLTAEIQKVTTSLNRSFGNYQSLVEQTTRVKNNILDRARLSEIDQRRVDLLELQKTIRAIESAEITPKDMGILEGDWSKAKTEVTAYSDSISDLVENLDKAQNSLANLQGEVSRINVLGPLASNATEIGRSFIAYSERQKYEMELLQNQFNLLVLQADRAAYVGQKAVDIKDELARKKFIETGIDDTNTIENSARIYIAAFDRQIAQLGTLVEASSRYKDVLLGIQRIEAEQTATDISLENREKEFKILQQFSSLYSDNTTKLKLQLVALKEENALAAEKENREIRFLRLGIETLRATVGANEKEQAAIEGAIKARQQQIDLLEKEASVRERIEGLKEFSATLEILESNYSQINSILDQTYSNIQNILELEQTQSAEQAKRELDVEKQQKTLQLSTSKLVELEAYKLYLIDQGAEKNKEILSALDQQILTSKSQVEQEKNKLYILEQQANVIARMQRDARAAFEGALQTGIADLIKDNEDDISEIIRQIAITTLESLADSAASMLTESIMTALGIGKDNVMQQAIEAAGETNAAMWRTVFDEAAQKIASAIRGEAPASRVDSVNAALDAMFEKEKAAGTDYMPQPGMIEKLEKIFSSDATWLEKLGGLFGAFGQGIGGLIQQIMGMFSGGGATSGGGGTGALIGTAVLAGIKLISKANGGILQKGFQAYATGGIATKPTVGLVGEGKYNEAIVPLPDGKSIPVMMENSAGMTNNVGVTVNINGAQTSTSVDGSGANAAQFGRAISNAVQAEIRRQKRPGGLLSPYGG